MNYRILRTLSFTTSLFCLVSGAIAPLKADQPAPVFPRPANQKPPVRAVNLVPVEEKKAGPVVAKINLNAPFMRVGGISGLPAKPAEEVQLFESDAAFRRFAEAEHLTVRKVGEFASSIIPEDEPEFRRVLRGHAGELGADYMVMVTDPAEIKQLFDTSHGDGELFYCAWAYKRVTARLGIEADKAAAKAMVTKISGFLPGSRGEASGLQLGDIVKKVAGEVPGAFGYWKKAVHWKVGDTVKVEIEREGKTLELDVVLSAG